MAITVLYTDLRIYPSELTNFLVAWKPNMTAKDAIKECLGETKTQDIEKDLNDNNREITVAWWHKPSGKISEVGGVGTILWVIDDGSVITISYDGKDTTQAQIDESIEWVLKQDI